MKVEPFLDGRQALIRFRYHGIEYELDFIVDAAHPIELYEVFTDNCVKSPLYQKLIEHCYQQISNFEITE